MTAELSHTTEHQAGQTPNTTEHQAGQTPGVQEALADVLAGQASLQQTGEETPHTPNNTNQPQLTSNSGLPPDLAINSADIQTLSALIKLPSNMKASDFLPRNTQNAKAYFSALQTEAKTSENKSLFSRLGDKISMLKDSISFKKKAKVIALLGVLIQGYVDISSGKFDLSTVQENFMEVLGNANPYKIFKAMSPFVADTKMLKTFLQIS